MDIKLGHTDADPRVLDKSGFSGTTVSVQISDNCDIKRPVFLLDVANATPGNNYAYVPHWHAYYFLSEPVIMDGVRATVTGYLDYLTTYADDIRLLSGYLVRTADSDKQNKFVRDNKKPVQANRQCKTYAFDRSPFTANYATDIVYLLTVIGGNHSDN